MKISEECVQSTSRRLLLQNSFLRGASQVVHDFNDSQPESSAGVKGLTGDFMNRIRDFRMYGNLINHTLDEGEGATKFRPAATFEWPIRNGWPILEP